MAKKKITEPELNIPSSVMKKLPTAQWTSIMRRIENWKISQRSLNKEASKKGNNVVEE